MVPDFENLSGWGLLGFSQVVAGWQAGDFLRMSVKILDARTALGAAKATSQIVSVDVNTAKNRAYHGLGLKLLPQYVRADNIGFLAKAGENQGIGYTNGQAIKGEVAFSVVVARWD